MTNYASFQTNLYFADWFREDTYGIVNKFWETCEFLWAICVNITNGHMQIISCLSQVTKDISVINGDGGGSRSEKVYEFQI